MDKTERRFRDLERAVPCIGSHATSTKRYPARLPTAERDMDASDVLAARYDGDAIFDGRAFARFKAGERFVFVLPVDVREADTIEERRVGQETDRMEAARFGMEWWQDLLDHDGEVQSLALDDDADRAKLAKWIAATLERG